MNIHGSLQPVPPVSSPLETRPLQPAQPASQSSFAQMLKGFVDDVDNVQKAAEETVRGFAVGKVDNVHEVMSALGKAEVSFKFMMEVRNRLIEAYQEIMRMPV